MVVPIKNSLERISVRILNLILISIWVSRAEQNKFCNIFAFPVLVEIIGMPYVRQKLHKNLPNTTLTERLPLPQTWDKSSLMMTPSWTSHWCFGESLSPTRGRSCSTLIQFSGTLSINSSTSCNVKHQIILHFHCQRNFQIISSLPQHHLTFSISQNVCCLIYCLYMAFWM